MHCYFHPSKPAVHACQQCERQYCLHCTDESEQIRSFKAMAQCFVCGCELDEIRNDQRIVPFWKRLKDIYLYPISTDGLIAMAFLYVAGLILSIAGFIGQMLFAITISLYWFACLRQTAEGRLQAPEAQACVEGPIGPVFYQVIVLISAISFVVNAYDKFGNGIGTIAMIFFVCALPAALIIITIEESMKSALNPVRLFEVMHATGSSYFVMLLFLIMMLSSMAVLDAWLSEVDLLWTLLGTFITLYYGIIVYHILGYLVYQNQDALGWDNARRDNPALANARDESAILNARIETLIKAGEFENARHHAKQQVNNPKAPIWQWKRALNVACCAKPSKDAPALFVKFADKVIEDGDLDDLVDGYQTLNKAFPGYTPPDHALRVTIGEALANSGKHSQAIQLVQKLDKETDDQSLHTRAYKVLADSFSHFPEHKKHADYFAKLHALQTGS